MWKFYGAIFMLSFSIYVTRYSFKFLKKLKVSEEMSVLRMF